MKIWRKRKNWSKRKLITKNKGRGKKIFSNWFDVFSLKQKECEYVEFCAPPLNLEMFFLRFFFSSLLNLLIFCSDMQWAVNGWRIYLDFHSIYTTFSVGRAHAIQKCADWFVFWSIILAAHPSVKTLMFRFVKELLMQRRSCTSFPRKAWRGWSPQHPRGRTTRSSSP